MPAPDSAPGEARLPRVLVVDDEPLVGRAVRRVLADRTEVACATGAGEALALLEDRAQHFDLVLCDLMMPEMNGAEFRAAMLRVRPELGPRLVFITGGAFTPEMERFLEQCACPHVLKPFDVPALRGLVAERLGG
ncbi:MAG TPA: response regulator [Anaeromyxobacteraceae bacterium]|nr:response regulator [Anaeromyxobacteraceae bacterium]